MIALSKCVRDPPPVTLLWAFCCILDKVSLLNVPRANGNAAVVSIEFSVYVYPPYLFLLDEYALALFDSKPHEPAAHLPNLANTVRIRSLMLFACSSGYAAMSILTIQ
jgi:hypothetical protein